MLAGKLFSMPEITFEVDDATFARLVRLADRAGLTVPELLQRDLEKETPRLSMEEWFERIRARGIRSHTTSEEILAVLDEWRGPWPEPQENAP